MGNNIIISTFLFLLIFGCRSSKKFDQIMPFSLNDNKHVWYSTSNLLDSNSTDGIRMYSSERLVKSYEPKLCPRYGFEFDREMLVSVQTIRECGDPPRGPIVKACFYPYQLVKTNRMNTFLISKRSRVDTFVIQKIKMVIDQYDDELLNYMTDSFSNIPSVKKQIFRERNYIVTIRRKR